MRTISSVLQTHLSGGLTTLATCWKLTLRDTTELGFTDHDQEIEVEGLLYKASSGIQASAISSHSHLNVDNLDVEGLLDSELIKEADLLAGRYDFAEVEIFLVNYTAPAEGKIILRTGWIGEITSRKGYFLAEIRGLSQKLKHQVGAYYSAACRAELGDSRCQVSLGPLTVTGTVTSVSSRQVFSDSARNEAAGYFDLGKITFTSGQNAGYAMEIKRFTGAGELSLVLPMPFEVESGDAYSLIPGCDKTFATCVERYANAVNFRGEPHVPGVDKALETAGTRSGS